MAHAIRVHPREHREDLQGLIEQAFRTLSLLTIVLVLIAIAYAVFYTQTG